MAFSTPTTCARKILTPSLLTLHNLSDHEGSPHVDQGRTHPLKPSDNESQISHPDSSCPLLTPLSSASQSDPKRHSYLGMSRPSVIVYKVATGPNLAGTRDIIRVSYGEGHRKRIRSDHRNKDLNLGRQGYPPEEYGNARRDEAVEHLNRKAIRSKLYSARRCYGKRSLPSGLRRSDTKVSGKLPRAERVEGDMAWDFGFNGAWTRIALGCAWVASLAYV